MSRNHAIFVAALLGLSGLSAGARAQACESDADCVTGNWCVYDGGGTDSSGGDTRPPTGELVPICDGPDCPVVDPDPTPDPTPVKGTCEPLPRGLCVDEGDCSPELECLVPSVGSCVSVSPEEGGGATALPKQTDCMEEPASYGYCNLPEMKCTTDAQCLTGLKCVESYSSSTPDSSGTVEPTCGPGADCATDSSDQAGTKQADPASESTCQVAFDRCDEATLCKGGYECIEEVTGCTSSGGEGTSGTGATDPGEPVDAGAATTESAAGTKQREPNCDYESSCYPKFTPCNSDLDCTTGWVCFTFDGENQSAPDYWNQTGMVKSCLPKGLALAAEASGGYGKGGLGDAASDNEQGTARPTEAGGGQLTAPKGDGTGSTCSVGMGPGAQGAAWLLGIFALVSRRRRQV